MSSVRHIPAAGVNGHLPHPRHSAVVYGAPLLTSAATLFIDIQNCSEILPHVILSLQICRLATCLWPLGFALLLQKLSLADRPTWRNVVRLANVVRFTYAWRRGVGQGALAGGVGCEDAKQADADAAVRSPRPAGKLHASSCILRQRSVHGDCSRAFNSLRASRASLKKG